jgi:biofilm PGA synthesis N-glycosyltransferase PgaC
MSEASSQGDVAALPTYALITPARNEVGNLPRLTAAILAQTHRPLAWVIVDDGSDDGTTELVRDLAAEHPWVELLDRTRERGGDVLAGRREGRDLISFKAGVAQLDVQPDIVAKVDADLSFDADYWARLTGEFATDPQLAIASGACNELEDGAWVRRRVVDGAVWGASRAYRSDCLFSMLDLEPRMGWDGLDEFRVQVRGYRTQTFIDLPFRHHRPEHSRENGRLRAHAAQGRASWYMGYRPTYLMLRTAYRAVRDPAAVGMLWGYASAAAAREPQYPEHDVRRMLRERQRLARALRRGTPP